ncbi:hypothetical protein DFH09DRAFT_1346160 [Mycena vulgaris]|nr:hypothetical protein DFH09DRAFT_1346160 [Mycena vulgaris]
MSSSRPPKPLSKVEAASSDDEAEEESSMPKIWAPFNHICAEGLVTLMLQKTFTKSQRVRDQAMAAIHEAMPALDFHYDHWMDGPGAQQAKPILFRRFYHNLFRILRYTGLCATAWTKYLDIPKYPLPDLPADFELPFVRVPKLDLDSRPAYPSLDIVLFQIDAVDDEVDEEEDDGEDYLEEDLAENHSGKSSGGRPICGLRPPSAATETAPTDTPAKPKANREVPPTTDTKVVRALRSGNSASGSATKSKAPAPSKMKGKRKASTTAPTDDEDELNARAKKTRTSAADLSDEEMKEDEGALSESEGQKVTHADSGKGPKLEPIKALIPRDISTQVTKVLEKRFARTKKSKEDFPQINIGLGPTHPYFYAFVAIRRNSDAPAANFYSHITPRPVARQTSRVQYQPIFKDAKLIDAEPIRSVKLEEGILPLIACPQSIFLNEQCIHLGYGAQCFNCNKLRICCGDRMTVPEPSDVTENIFDELVQSFKRASSLALVYDDTILDLQRRLRHAADHAALCVKHMGTETFIQRFDDNCEGDNIFNFLNLVIKSTGSFAGPSKIRAASEL